MKGLMFNNKYGLQDSVLNGSKTMTRRNVSNKLVTQYEDWLENASCVNVPEGTSYETFEESISKRTPYEIGEVVAIKQAYKDINIDFIPYIEKGKCGNPKGMAGWDNKMFVRTDVMPHHIRITNIKLEALQDISDEDCMKEGVKVSSQGFYFCHGIGTRGVNRSFVTPKEAYKALIDKINGKGTWDKNDLVWAIEFELID